MTPAEHQRWLEKFTQADCDELADFTWPMVYFKIHGIPQGQQWSVLGWLAARYIRLCGVEWLADELWSVMQASPQDERDPWRRSHAKDIAARAERFIDRADARNLPLMRAHGAALHAWVLGQPVPPPLARQPGARPARVRRPGVRA